MKIATAGAREASPSREESDVDFRDARTGSTTADKILVSKRRNTSEGLPYSVSRP